MTFVSIIKKNFSHNLKKYISFYFVNSLIVAMLFMYGNLMYNSDIMSKLEENMIYDMMKLSLSGIGIFSVLFITYTNITFLKSRGKEFGTYRALGMTWKDLSKIILIENVGILIISIGTGLLSGILFSRLFYMVLNKILISQSIKYEITLKGILLSIVIFGIIFICNIIFNIIYTKKVSIVNFIKASKNKEVGKGRYVIGVISLIIFVASIYSFQKILSGTFFKGNQYAIATSVILMITTPYMIIGSIISLIKKIFSKFEKSYNKNLLILSNLSHRFIAYKNIIYMSFLLLLGAVIFIGMTYSLYITTKETVENENPFDITFIENNKYNKIDKREVESIINSKGKIKYYSQLEFIDVNEFREKNDKVEYWGGSISVTSISNYNKHMNGNYKVKDNEAIKVFVNKEKNQVKESNIILSYLSKEKLNNISDIARKDDDFLLEKEIANDFFKDETIVSIEGKNIKLMEGKFANGEGNGSKSFSDIIVVSDLVYKNLKSLVKEDDIKKVHVINAQNSDIAFYNLIDHLRKINGFDTTYWAKASINQKVIEEEKDIKESYRPLSKDELIKLNLERSGIQFFCMIFIGILFIIASGVLLYYKILTDIEQEKERVNSLEKVGVTLNTIKKTISKELKIVFIMPIILGGSLGIYLIYSLFDNRFHNIIKYILKGSFTVIIFMVIAQVIFYIIARRKYINEVIVK